VNTEKDEGPRKSSGFTRKSSPGSYALAEADLVPEAVAEPVSVTLQAAPRAAVSSEDRIEALKAYHHARMRLAVLSAELSTAPASDIVPGVTAAYVEAMRQCLQVLLLNSDVAEGL